MADVAVITIAAGRHEQLRAQRATLAGVPHIVVAMGDPAIAAIAGDCTVIELGAGPELPLAAARNAGAACALELGVEVLIFLDVDCLAGPELVSRYVAAAQRAPDDLLCGPVTYLAEGSAPRTPAEFAAVTRPHPARPAPEDGEVVRGGDHDLFWSLSFAVRATTWRRVGGFCEDYLGYGAEDTDFAWTARARGVGLTWVGGASAYHQWHPVSRPPVEHVDAIVRNARIAYARWGRWPMTGWLAAFVDRGLIDWDPAGAVIAVK